MMEGACLFLRVHHPYACLPPHAGSPEGERMELFDRKEEGETNHHLLPVPVLIL